MKHAELFHAEMKPQGDEGGGRIMLGDNTGGGVVMLRPGRFQCDVIRISSGLLRARVQTHTHRHTHTYSIYIYIYIYIYIHCRDCSKIRLGLDHPGRNNCISRGCLYVETTDLYGSSGISNERLIYLVNTRKQHVY
jgi:hypothetical protein